jgi:hypothetical protein
VESFSWRETELLVESLLYHFLIYAYVHSNTTQGLCDPTVYNPINWIANWRKGGSTDNAALHAFMPHLVFAALYNCLGTNHGIDGNVSTVSELRDKLQLLGVDPKATDVEIRNLVSGDERFAWFVELDHGRKMVSGNLDLDGDDTVGLSIRGRMLLRSTSHKLNYLLGLHALSKSDLGGIEAVTIEGMTGATAAKRLKRVVLELGELELAAVRAIRQRVSGRADWAHCLFALAGMETRGVQSVSKLERGLFVHHVLVSVLQYLTECEQRGLYGKRIKKDHVAEWANMLVDYDNRLRAVLQG